MFQTLAGYPVALTVTDIRTADTPIIFTNDAFTQLTGHSAEEAIGQNVSFLFGPRTDIASASKLVDALGEGRSSEVEVLNYKRDGTSYWSKVSLSPVAVSGRPAFVIIVHTDVTVERQRASAEAELQASQERLNEANERLRLTLSLTGAAAAWEWNIGRKRDRRRPPLCRPLRDDSGDRRGGR